MDSIINYSSEEEQEEAVLDNAARSTNLVKRCSTNRSSSTSSGSSSTSSSSSSTTTSADDHTPYRAGTEGSGGGGGANGGGGSATGSGGRVGLKEEVKNPTSKTCAPVNTSVAGGERFGSSSHTFGRDNGKESKDREGRDGRDTRESRDGRSSKDFGNDSRPDHKATERQRSRDYVKSDYKRDNDSSYRTDRRPAARDDDRKHAFLHQKERATKNSRDERPRFSESSSRRQYRSRDERDERGDRSERIDRNDRNERFDRSDRSDRSDRNARNDRNDRNDRNERANYYDRSERQRRRRDSRSASPHHHQQPSQYQHHHYHHQQQQQQQQQHQQQQQQHQQQQQQQQQHSKRSNRNDERYSRYRSRSSRSRSRSYSKERIPQPLEQARLTALEMERKLNAEEPPQFDKFNPESSNHKQSQSRSTEAVITLPLNDTAPKQPNVIAVTPAATSSSHHTETSVIQLPSYYNASVINPSKYAEQVQKRKLLWGAKKNEDTSAKWGNAQFSQDSDGKVASKFMRLMGIKGAVAGKPEAPESTDKATVTPDVKSREAMFNNMEQQYEVARQVTHTMRGVGLGFGSQSRQF